jgi:hypothetical protein
MTDLAWAGRSDDPIADVVDPSKKTKPIPGRVDMQELPGWVKQFVSTEKLSCPAKAPF